MKETIRVIVRQESDGKRKAWVAFGLEQFLAAQTQPGAGYADAIDALGEMFDMRDVVVRHYAATGEQIAPVPPAPDDLQALWDQAEPSSCMSLGATRWAEVRRVGGRP